MSEQMDELQIKKLIKTAVEENVKASQEQQAEYLAELLLKKINIASIQKENTNQSVSYDDEDWRVVRDWVKSQIEKEKRLEELYSNNKINYTFKGLFALLGFIFGLLGVAGVAIIQKISGGG